MLLKKLWGALLVTAGILAASGAGEAGIVTIADLDAANNGEWDASNYQGTRQSSPSGNSPSFAVNIYSQFDANYLYAAYIADTSDPDWSSRALTTVNAYIYPNFSITGDPYGNGNDILIEAGNHQWGYGSPTGFLTPPGPQPFTQLDPINNPNLWGDATAGIYSAWNPTSNVYEVAIARSQLGNFTNGINIGGQMWSYDFVVGNASVQTTATPEPTSSLLLLSSASLGAWRIRRRRRQLVVDVA